jgi:AcrR family transcriptional regulator
MFCACTLTSRRRSAVMSRARCPDGPHGGLSREAVQRRQRERLLYATTLAVAEQGYARTTVAAIIAKAACRAN